MCIFYIKPAEKLIKIFFTDRKLNQTMRMKLSPKFYMNFMSNKSMLRANYSGRFKENVRIISIGCFSLYFSPLENCLNLRLYLALRKTEQSTASLHVFEISPIHV